MAKKRSKSKGRCENCEKKLKKFSCWNCDGEGENRSLLFFKKRCEVCSGKGFVKRCPDHRKHFLGRSKFLPNMRLESRPVPKTRMGKFGKVNHNLNAGMKPGNKGPVLPPWHPNNPNTSHPAHPRNINNPANPNSRNHPHNPNNQINVIRRRQRNNPINKNRR